MKHILQENLILETLRAQTIKFADPRAYADNMGSFETIDDIEWASP